MYNEFIKILKEWSIDIQNINFKYYDNFILSLINEHYIIKLEKTS